MSVKQKEVTSVQKQKIRRILKSMKHRERKDIWVSDLFFYIIKYNTNFYLYDNLSDLNLDADKSFIECSDVYDRGNKCYDITEVIDRITDLVENF